MDSAPLTLRILHLTPLTLIPTSSSPDPSIPPIPLPPPPPPDDFAFSPTPNYPPPLGTIHMGSHLACTVALENTHRQRYPVLGVKMMLELQTPATRTRLGEVIHRGPVKPGEGGEEEGEGEMPELAFGERVELSAESEVKDLGLGVVIAITPLSIKTRIQSPTHPNTLLSPSLRHETFLEVLMQNTSPNESLLLSSVLLQPIDGLVAHKVGGDGDAHGLEGEELRVGDVRQYLFVLSPIPPPPPGKTGKGQVSNFPPTHMPGEILPLGRLAIKWISGAYHTPGELLTSMLNRRAPALASLPAAKAALTAGAGAGAGAGARDSLKPPGPGRGPAPGPGTPGKLPVHQPSPIPASPSPLRRLPSSSPSEHPLPAIPSGPSNADNTGGEEETRWTYDLVMLSSRRGLKKGHTCALTFRLSIRSAEAIDGSLIASGKGKGKKPSLPRLAIQYLTPLPLPHNSPVPQSAIAISAPLSLPHPSARSSAPTARPFTPSSSAPTASTSRPMTPMTPLRAELKSAVGGFINNGNAPGNAPGGGSGSGSRPGTPGTQTLTSVAGAGAGAGAGKRESLQPSELQLQGGGEHVMGTRGRVPWPPSPHVAFNSSSAYRPAGYPAAGGVAAAMARIGSGQSHTSGQGRKAALGASEGEAKVVEVYHMGNSLTFLDFGKGEGGEGGGEGEGEVREVVDWYSIPPPLLAPAPAHAPNPAPAAPDLSVSPEKADEGADKSSGEGEGVAQESTPIPIPPETETEIKPSPQTQEEGQEEVQEEGIKYWEASVEWSWDFLGWETGVGVLGGLRVLRFVDDDDADADGEDGEKGEGEGEVVDGDGDGDGDGGTGDRTRGGSGREGTVEREWDCLGDVWVV
ncbi:hypothetical protein B9479_005943 [Cryptococcus floricola]|uniref:Trafficking protein particle complex subunit 13 middle domain-containing protein n=1 Tax=Cryptococcus floricola TaxID=2591691 RepID=A0A5D3AUI0_9TREE|nr:hypothetical protein B9479_005943 [Cryptococcus floricola]